MRSDTEITAAGRRTTDGSLDGTPVSQPPTPLQLSRSLAALRISLMSMCYVNRERDQVERIRYRFDETMRSVNGRNFPTAYGYHPTSVGVDRKHWLLCGGTGSRKIPTKLFETFHDEIDSIRKYNKVKQTHSVARHVDLVKEDYNQITLQTHVSSAVMTITYRHGT